MADRVFCHGFFRFPGTDFVCCAKKGKSRNTFFDKKPLQIQGNALYYVYYSDR